MCATGLPCISIFPGLHTCCTLTRICRASCAPWQSLTADLTAHPSPQEALALHTSSTLFLVSHSQHTALPSTCTPSKAWISLGPLTAPAPGSVTCPSHTFFWSLRHCCMQQRTRLSGPHNHCVYSHAVHVGSPDACMDGA